MSITFYYAPQSSATRVHWALEELGLAYEKVRVDLRAGQQKSPDFLAVNPNGKVPALVVDGTPMFESLAIILYLAERWGIEKNLWPRVGTTEHAEALTWSVWGTVAAGGSLWRIFYNTSTWLPAESHNAVQAEMAKQEFAEAMRILDTRLQGREYLVGDHFTLVDVCNASLLGWASMMNMLDLAAYPNIAAWLGRCRSRPANAVATAD